MIAFLQEEQIYFLNLPQKSNGKGKKKTYLLFYDPMQLLLFYFLYGFLKAYYVWL